MVTPNAFRMMRLLGFVVVLINGGCYPCLAQPANYEAANWNTWLLDKPQQITISAPPAAAQAKAELKAVRQGLAQLDEKKMAAIKYWDAGAPAYRWNQIAPELFARKFDEA